MRKPTKTTKQIEAEIFEVINRPQYNNGDFNLLIESAVAMVGEGAGNPFIDNGNTNELPHKGRVILTMREFKMRAGVLSEDLRKDIQTQLDGKFPGVSISVEKDANGPAAGYPITIEITGKEYLALIQTAQNMKDYLNRVNIAGVEELKIDVNKNKPGIKLNIDREKSRSTWCFLRLK